MAPNDASEYRRLIITTASHSHTENDFEYKTYMHIHVCPLQYPAVNALQLAIARRFTPIIQNNEQSRLGT